MLGLLGCVAAGCSSDIDNPVSRATDCAEVDAHFSAIESELGCAPPRDETPGDLCRIVADEQACQREWSALLDCMYALSNTDFECSESTRELNVKPDPTTGSSKCDAEGDALESCFRNR